MLDLDLMRLGNPERFQSLCFRLARRAFPKAAPFAFSSHDGGRDVIHLKDFDGKMFTHDIVWQAKFTDDLGGATKRSIDESIRSIEQRPDMQIRKWILCLPVDPTGVFHDWLTKRLAPTGWEWEVWGRSRLLALLEENGDVVQNFFYAAYEELRRVFVVEELTLVEMRLDLDCQWRQPDEGVLAFASENVESPDLLLDVIVQNTGEQDAVLLWVEATVFDWRPMPHGIPGSALLHPQITYEVPIGGGQPGTYRKRCEPPLLVRGRSADRFEIRLTETGYAWNGGVQVVLGYSGGRELALPAFRLFT